MGSTFPGIKSKYPPLPKDEAIRQMEAVSKPYARRYCASIQDAETEVQRLTSLLKSGKGPNSVRVRLKALGPEFWSAALLECYEQARRAEDRRDYVRSAIFEARESNTARRLGLRALHDRSYTVRYRAHQVLAYSLDRSVLPAMRDALKVEPREDMRKLLKAAINAIEKQNHHFYIDRKESGHGRWSVQPWDSGDPVLQHASLSWEIERIKAGWETEI